MPYSLPPITLTATNIPAPARRHTDVVLPDRLENPIQLFAERAHERLGPPLSLTGVRGLGSARVAPHWGGRFQFLVLLCHVRCPL